MKHILLVEDDLSLIEGLEFSLHRHNVEVVVARTVQDALTKLSEQTHRTGDGSLFDNTPPIL